MTPRRKRSTGCSSKSCGTVLLGEADLQQQTWAILRRVVIDELLQDFREELAAMDSGVGLYPALGKLPQRQFDVIVLRYIFDYRTERISWYLGVTPSTVDYHCRKARERLAPVYRNRYGMKEDPK
ncbi:RNA polymerase sigma factor [Streptomyces sp. NPDC086787]|uniref:RNA polymerase sigma factor n=1 Tax=Streptomyces sp. NPDC086787 TaxID=3365759 RepID=UPI00381771FC